jgi:hypothetical protein
LPLNLSKDKHSSLFRRSICDKEKRFITVASAEMRPKERINSFFQNFENFDFLVLLGRVFHLHEGRLDQVQGRGHQGPRPKLFIFFITYKWAQKLERYIALGWKDLPGTHTLTY